MKNKKILLFTIAIVSSFLFLGSSKFDIGAYEFSSATYYVDYATGADTNNGTSTSTPFKHSPGDQDATDTAGSTTLSPGDTVIFKGGVTYEFDATGNNYIELSGGSAGNIITYISGHVAAPTWGTGRAVIDCTNATPAAAGKYGVFSGFRVGYFTIQGLEMHSFPDTASEHRGLIGFKDSNSGTANYITIDDVLFHTFNTAGVMAEGRYMPGTVPSNLTIKNSTMYDSYAHLINVKWGWSDVLIENNDLDQAGSNPYSALDPKSNPISFARDPNDNDATDVVIRGNRLGDSTATDNKGLVLIQQHMNNLTVEDNYFYGTPPLGSPHIVGGGSNWIFRNNVWHLQPTRWESGGLRFYNGYDSDGGDIDGIRIHNNTFVSETKLGGGIIWFKAGSDTGIQYRNVDIRNNIFDTGTKTSEHAIYIGNTTDGSNIPVVDFATLTIDNNAYYSLKSTPFYIADDGGARTFTQWKTYLTTAGVSGADANSNIGKVAFTNEAGDDFTLDASDTVALNEGVDLTASGVTDDFLGTPRPQGAAWDIGAYEYSGSNPAPNPTCSDNIQNQNETGIDCGGICPACPTTPAPITYNLTNFISLVSNWLRAGNSTSDVNNDGIVNTRDLGIIMSSWTN